MKITIQYQFTDDFEQHDTLIRALTKQYNGRSTDSGMVNTTRDHNLTIPDNTDLDAFRSALDALGIPCLETITHSNREYQ